MSGRDNKTNASNAAERFFRLYHSHCVAPNRDTLFSFLEAAHSLNDRLQSDEGLNFSDLPEFLALRCLRNFFHHHQELRHVVRAVPARDYPIVTELMILCLVPRDIVERAGNETRGRRKEEVWDACRSVFHWYGSVVNINPALFNFVVSAYERIKGANVALADEAFQQFQAIYFYEKAIGCPHRVEGRLAAHAGNIDQLLANIMNTKGL